MICTPRTFTPLGCSFCWTFSISLKTQDASMPCFHWGHSPEAASNHWSSLPALVSATLLNQIKLAGSQGYSPYWIKPDARVQQFWDFWDFLSTEYHIPQCRKVDHNQGYPRYTPHGLFIQLMHAISASGHNRNCKKFTTLSKSGHSRVWVYEYDHDRS